MIDPSKKEDLQKLGTDIERCDQLLKPFRDKRTELVRQQMGAQYPGGTPDDEKVPLPLLYEARETYRRELAGSCPILVIGARTVRVLAEAEVMQTKVRELLDEIDFAHTLSLLIGDAMDSFAIAKVGVERMWKNDELGILHDSGQAFFERVSLDDLIIDMDATRLDRILYIGDRYRVPIEDVKENDLFDKKAREALTSDEDIVRTTAGQVRLDELAKQGLGTREDDFAPMVELADVLLVRERKVVTFAPRQADIALHIVKWNGPERGPYHILGFGDLADQLLPFAPLAMARDLHDLVNALFRKMSNQAEGQKNVGITQRGDDADALTLKEASDGDLLGLSSPGSISNLSVGGVHEQTAVFAASVLGLNDRFQGNIQSIAGLAPTAPTATQEVMIDRRSQSRVAGYQDLTRKFAKRVVRDLAWYWYRQPGLDMSGDLRMPYSDLKIQVSLRAKDRSEQDWLQYNFDIQAGSMRQRGPEETLAVIDRFMDKMGPYLQLLTAQGLSIDFQALIDTTADLTNVPQLRRIITAAIAEPESQQGGPTQAAHTVREEVRRTAPAAPSPQGGMATQGAEALI